MRRDWYPRIGTAGGVRSTPNKGHACSGSCTKKRRKSVRFYVGLGIGANDDDHDDNDDDDDDDDDGDDDYDLRLPSSRHRCASALVVYRNVYGLCICMCMGMCVPGSPGPGPCS